MPMFLRTRVARSKQTRAAEVRLEVQWVIRNRSTCQLLYLEF